MLGLFETLPKISWTQKLYLSMYPEVEIKLFRNFGGGGGQKTNPKPVFTKMAVVSKFI